METIRLEIVTPYGKVFDNSVKSVTLPGSEGEFGVLPHHSSIVSLLKTGVVDIEKSDGSKESIVIDWGYANVNETNVSIIADKAIALSGADVSKAIAEAVELVKAVSEPSLVSAALISKIESKTKR
jgi:F-type H+-transporting ATPase subunit epsilon